MALMISGSGILFLSLGNLSGSFHYYDKALAIEPNYTVASKDKELALLNILKKDDLYTKSFPKYCPLQYDRFYGLWIMGFN